MADTAGSALKGRAAAADNDVEDTSCCFLDDLAAARDRAVRDCRRCESDSILFVCNGFTAAALLLWLLDSSMACAGSLS